MMAIASADHLGSSDRMKKELRKYLAEIGAKGGKASCRKITPEQQAAMQEARKAKRRSQGSND